MEKNRDVRICRIENDTGSGTMTVYEPFPGVSVTFHDFRMERCVGRPISGDNFIFLDYCRTGKIIWNADDHRCVTCSEGDIQVNVRWIRPGQFAFPSHQYKGITVAWDLDRADEAVSFMREPPNLHQLARRLCPNGRTLLIRGSQRVENIFAELYLQPAKAIPDYCRVKVMELMLFLCSAEAETLGHLQAYCSKSQMDKIKKIEEFITVNAEKRFTLQELSAQFHFPLTAMKQCFKCVYGMPIYHYLRSYRMKQAARLLQETDRSIMEIAGSVGYENAGKFSEAFVDVMGQKPMEYRRSFQKR